MQGIRLNTYLKIFFFVFTANLLLAQAEISGSVTDISTGEALIGASIRVQGSGLGTITDYEGNYALGVPYDAILEVSYTGYETQSVAVSGRAQIDIQLSSGKILDEVVVIGYGTVKREDATGAIQSVDSDKFNQGSIMSPQELLAGKIAGVSITPSADPGGGARIRIRGESSLSSSNDPLIVIDGVPIESDKVSGSRNPLNIINPNDIETFTVLKDASATAIYGNRASGGVILITTKKGTAGGKIKVGYTGNISQSERLNSVDVLTADEFRDIINATYDEDHPSRALLGSANTDWQEQIFAPAFGMDHNLSASGGIGNLPFRASVGYSDKKGILQTDHFQRLTGGLNLNPKFLDNTLQVNVSLKAMNIKNRFADRGAIGNALGFDPTQTPLDPGNNFGGFTTWTTDTLKTLPNILAPTNPLALLNLKEDRSEVKRYVTQVSADYRLPFFPAMRANLNLAYDLSEGAGTVQVDTLAAFAFDNINGGGTNNVYNHTKKNSLLEFFLNYKKAITIHEFDIMGGYSWQKFENTSTFTNSDFNGTPSETTIGDDLYQNFLVSFFGRFNYSLKDKYLFTFTLRQDGTSRFAPESRWGLFPAAAVGIKVFENQKTYFNKLKIRAGWGVTGNQEIGNNVKDFYIYQPIYQQGFENAQYQFGDEYYTTYRPNGYNAGLKWEETSTINLGADYSLIADRLTGSLDIYSRNTKDLLNVVAPPAGTNLTNRIITNVGDMQTQGIEIAFQAAPVVRENVLWDVNLNMSYNENEITRLTEFDDPEYEGILVGGIAGGVGSNIQIHSVGYSPYAFYVYEQVYDESGDIVPGEFVDQNADGIINELDQYRFEKPAPDFIFGLSSNLNVRDFTFSFAGRANVGNYAYNNVQTDIGFISRLYGSTGVTQNIHQSAIDNNAQDQSQLTFSDHFVQNASFFRLDYTSLAYNLEKLLGLNAKVSLIVQNPLLITNYTGIDPELDNGIDNNIYPRSRTYVLGFSVNF